MALRRNSAPERPRASTSTASAPNGAAGAASQASVADDNLESIRALKLGGALAILFELAYQIANSQAIRDRGPDSLTYHLLVLGATALFFGITWTAAFRRFWKLWTFLFCAALTLSFTFISSLSTGAEPRFIAAVLCSLATPAFVRWNFRWQAAMNVLCLLAYTGAYFFLPVHDPAATVHWITLLAALTLSQTTSFFLDAYRGRLRLQMDQLTAGARFRERQVATMTHDIRDPLATLGGLVDLLEDDETDPDDQRNLLARIGSTVRSMNLLVTNLLDLYVLENGTLRPNPRPVDPNSVLFAATAEAAKEAALRGTKVYAELSEVPYSLVDPFHLERIVTNLLAEAIRRSAGGAVTIKSSVANGRIRVEVEDSDFSATAAEIVRVMAEPNTVPNGRDSSRMRLYVARELAAANGGDLKASSMGTQGVSFVFDLPIVAPKAGN